MDRHQQLPVCLSAAAVLIALASLGVTAYFNYRGSKINVANVRPILAISLEELSFEAKRVKIAVAVVNRGKTTAVVEHLRVTVHEDSANAFWITAMDGSLIYPGNSRREVLFCSRHSDVDGIVFDAKDSISAMGRLPVMIRYRARELPGDVFEESSQFSPLRWQNKSIIGLGD